MTTTTATGTTTKTDSFTDSSIVHFGHFGTANHCPPLPRRSRRLRLLVETVDASTVRMDVILLQALNPILYFHNILEYFHWLPMKYSTVILCSIFKSVIGLIGLVDTEQSTHDPHRYASVPAGGRMIEGPIGKRRGIAPGERAGIIAMRIRPPQAPLHTQPRYCGESPHSWIRSD